MAFGVAEGAMMLGGLTQGFMGGQKSPDPAGLHLVNKDQQELYRRMAQMYGMGAGDFGFGAGAKQVNAQTNQMLANSGLSAQGPGYGQAIKAQGYGNAAGMAAQNRNQFGMQLLGTPLQIAQTAGANYLPNSPSYGTNWEDSLNPANSYRRQFNSRG